jgi:PAS domain S-box-containing protein
MKVMDKTRTPFPSEIEVAETRIGREEEKLPGNEEFSYGLIEDLPNPVFIINTDTSIRYVNPALENLTGFTTAEVIGRKMPYPWWITGRSTGSTDTPVKTVSDRVHNLELYRKKDGEIFWVEVTIVPVIHNGEVQYFISSWIDVTRARKVEKQLIEISNYYKTILDGIMHGVMVIDKYDVIRYSNEVMTEITGMSPDKIYGKSIITDFLENRIACTCNHYLKAKKTLKPLYFNEVPSTAPGGGKKYQSFCLIPIVTAGIYNGMIITIEDITEQVQAENKLTKYEELSKLKSDFLAKISHELRSPLATIKGYSTMLLEYDQRLSNKEKQRYLEFIDNTTTTLTKLVSQLLDISHLNSGMFKLKKEPTNISRLLEEAVAEARLRSPGHEIVSDIENWLPRINIEASRIKQVMDNLIDNACKYSEERTRVIISARIKNIELLISVSDQGIGIPGDDIEKVFDQMYRVEQAQSLGKPGLGLGLAICREIVEAHGGRIWAESQPGKGSVFHFIIPIQNHNYRMTNHR